MADRDYMPVTRGADKSGACAAQEQPSAPPGKSAREFTRELFQWLDQVAIDPDLPASAFKVAYVIGEHVNRQTGQAWPASRTIAKAAALAQPTVIELVPKLVANGHLALEPGRAGRGHSHRYSLIIKDQPADHLRSSEKIGQPIIRKIRKDQVSGEMIGQPITKDRPADQNLLPNLLKEPLRASSNQESKEGPANAAAARHQVFEKEEAEATTIDQWLSATTVAERREAFSQIFIDEGATSPTELETQAVRFLEHYRSTDELRPDWPEAWRAWVQAIVRQQQAASRKASPT
jgi:hypothetical protein